MTNFTNIVSCIASSGTPFKNAESRKFDALRFVISFAQYWKQSAHHLVGNLHFLASHHLHCTHGGLAPSKGHDEHYYSAGDRKYQL